MRDVWQDAREFRHCRKASSGRDVRRWDDHTCTLASRSVYTDGTHGVGALVTASKEAITSFATFLTVHIIHGSIPARRPRCGNQQLESRVRENRQHGSEGGEAKAFPTPIRGVQLRLSLDCFAALAMTGLQFFYLLTTPRLSSYAVAGYRLLHFARGRQNSVLQRFHVRPQNEIRRGGVHRSVRFDADPPALASEFVALGETIARGKRIIGVDREFARRDLRYGRIDLVEIDRRPRRTIRPRRGA